jgi:hypothetical protein
VQAGVAEEARPDPEVDHLDQAALVGANGAPFEGGKTSNFLAVGLEPCRVSSVMK